MVAPSHRGGVGWCQCGNVLIVLPPVVLHLVQVYDQGIKPSNRLLLIVVLLSLVMALTVAGTAIGLIWINATDAKKSALTENLNMIKNAVEFFSVTQAFQRQACLWPFLSFLFAKVPSMDIYKPRFP